MAEGQSTSRPPLFAGLNYGFWKARMRTFIQAHDYDMWNIIINGPHTPTKFIDSIAVPKPEGEWNALDKKFAQLNAKAMNVLYCALNVDEFNRISTCNSAKEIWDRLEITHEGTNQVKESKIDILVHNYELFKMEHYESISDMFTRFTNIINNLQSLGRTYATNDLVRKILRSLPRSWEAKVTAIEEAKDLNKLSLEELLGSLMTHEMSIMDQEEDNIGGSKYMAFKSSNQEESSKSEESGDEEEELSLITKKFKNFLKMKKKKRQERKEALMATWSTSDESSSKEENEESEYLCLMAQEDEVSSESLDQLQEDLSFDDLLHAFHDLYGECKKLSIRNRNLKKLNLEISEEKQRFSKEKNEMIIENKELKLKAEDLLQINQTLLDENKIIQNDKEILIKENQSIIKMKNQLNLKNESLKLTLEELIQKNQKLTKENENLSEEVNKLKSVINKFTVSSERLKMIFESQFATLDKTRFGQIPILKPLKKIVINSSNKSSNKIIHPKYKNFICTSNANQLNGKVIIRQIWVPKGTISTNSLGPKQAWVPKTKN